MENRQIYQFYAELNDFEPKIWRRFQAANDITVAQFGYIVQVLFEMTASHLFCVEHERPFLTPSDKPGSSMELIKRYDIINEEDGGFDEPGEDAAKIKLNKLDLNAPACLTVWYDFGDDWRVSVILEKILEDTELPEDKAPDNLLPRVLEGKGFGIVEDVGGVWGLADLAEAFKDKKSDAYKELSEWLGVKDFDIEAFDLDDMNFRLKKIPRVYQQCYEDRRMPSRASIDLIERKYLKKKS